MRCGGALPPTAPMAHERELPRMAWPRDWLCRCQSLPDNGAGAGAEMSCSRGAAHLRDGVGWRTGEVEDDWATRLAVPVPVIPDNGERAGAEMS